MLDRAFYAELRALARRQSRIAADAEDLLHETLVAALLAGRTAGVLDRAWLRGTMRNLAAMQTRGAVRRRRREEASQRHVPPFAEQARSSVTAVLPKLPPALNIVLALALSGHTRAEIRFLLRVSDAALRQRIAELKRRLRAAGMSSAPSPWDNPLPLGSIRRGLLPLLRAGRADFASHDPDGHPIALRIRKPGPHEMLPGGNSGGQSQKGSIPCLHVHASATSASM